jgi:heme-degrading monooxygenase HmoA
VIGRLWSGRTTNPNDADAYEKVFRQEVLGELAAVAGFRGAYLLRDEHGEFVALTLFDSLDDVRRFAGEHYETANVSAPGGGVLAGFDSTARHFEVVVAP